MERCQPPGKLSGEGYGKWFGIRRDQSCHPPPDFSEFDRSFQVTTSLGLEGGGACFLLFGFAAVPQGDPSRRAAGTSDAAPATPSALPLAVCHTLRPGVQGSKPLNQGTGLEKVRDFEMLGEKAKIK